MPHLFPKYNVHVCFVSQQLLPNILLAFKEETKPKKIYLLTSTNFQEKAQECKNILEEKKIEEKKTGEKRIGVESEIHHLPSLSFKGLKQSITTVVENLLEKEDPASIALNLTGGTKLMTLAADRVSQKTGIPRFYVDTDNSVVVMLNTEASLEDKEYPLERYLTVRDILAINGYRALRSTASAKDNFSDKSFIQYVLGMKNPDSIKRLNKAASGAAEYKKKYKNDFLTEMSITPKDKHLFMKCEEAKLLTLYDNSNYIKFTDEKTHAFCHGAWLERHVEYVLKQLEESGHIDDYESSLKVITNGNTNELDAAFVYKNVPYFIECKTARMDNAEKSSAITYKIDSLAKNLGGALAKKILVSFLPLEPLERDRAKKNDITVVDNQKDIRNLKDFLIKHLAKEVTLS